MRRRDFVGGIVSSSVLLNRASRAQPSANPRRIAIVAPWHSIEEIRRNPVYRAFLDELAQLGFVEGENLIVDRYSGDGKLDSYPELARTVVSKNPEAILTGTGPMTLALKSATQSIPIVTIIGDPVVWGIAASLATGCKCDRRYRRRRDRTSWKTPGPFTRDQAWGITDSLPCIFVGMEAASSRHGSRGCTSSKAFAITSRPRE